MLKTERDIYEEVAAASPAGGHWTRIESPVSPGVADTFYCYGGRQTWIEFKVFPRGLRRSQAGWAAKLIKAGGRYAVIFGRTSGARIWLWGKMLSIPDVAPLVKRVSEEDLRGWHHAEDRYVIGAMLRDMGL